MSTISIVSMISPPHRVDVDPYATNPLAADYRQVSAATYDVALSKAGPPPKMFLGGSTDLPAFTASGIDPRLLAQLPFRARHAAAANPDPAAVAELFEDCANDPFAYVPHQGLSDAIQRVRDWARGRMDLKIADLPVFD